MSSVNKSVKNIKQHSKSLTEQSFITSVSRHQQASEFRFLAELTEFH